MEDLSILEAVERYITGQMSPDERVYFEGLRKSNPEIDQAVVEHTFFLQQMNRFEETRALKGLLNDAHIDLAEKGLIRSPKLKGRARVVYLFNRYKRTVAVAATIAGITAMTMSALVWSLSPVKPAKVADVEKLKGYFDQEINKNEAKINNVEQKLEGVQNQINSGTAPAPVYTGGGTGFLIDPKGFVVTSAHVVEGARNIAVQTDHGSDMSAELVYTDPSKDLAILKITDKRFKAPSSLPYAFRKTGGELAENVFTLGFPRQDIVYGDGYIAAQTGNKGDTLACQIAIPANKGNSGSPILNRNGEVIGIISEKLKSAEGAVFAIQTKYLFQVLNDFQQKQPESKSIKLPTSSSLKGKERSQQVKSIQEFVYLVKVD